MVSPCMHPLVVALCVALMALSFTFMGLSPLFLAPWPSTPRPGKGFSPLDSCTLLITLQVGPFQVVGLFVPQRSRWRGGFGWWKCRHGSYGFFLLP